MNHNVSKIDSKSISKNSKFSQDLRRGLDKLGKELKLDKGIIIFKGIELCKNSLN